MIAEMQPFLMLSIATKRYALAIENVIDVSAWLTLTPITSAPSVLLGMMNRRGTVLPVLDLHQLLDEAPLQPALQSVIITVNTHLATPQVGLAIETLPQVQYIATHHLTPTPIASPFVSHIIQTAYGIIQVLLLTPMLMPYIVQPT